MTVSAALTRLLARCPLPWGGMVGGLLLIVGLVSLLAPAVRAQDAVGPVHVVQVHGEIDLGLAPYLARVLRDAERAQASAVVLDINTPGGRLDAALQMRQALLDSPVRSVAFINRDAFSAGALIAIAADEIYMAPGAVFGAATPVTADGESAPPKTISAVRSTFRSTAEVRSRDPRVAEAMVDPEVAIDGLVERGQLLTLTTTDARDRGYADAIVANRQELLQVAGLSNAVVRETAPALAEQLVRIITNPIVASLLMTLGLLLVVADLVGGGGGVATTAGVGVIGLFFWGHMLAGLAGWEGVALIGLGLLLLALEVFVIPGFGVAGILGVAACAGGLFISLIGGEIVTDADLIRAATTVGATLVVSLIGAVGLLWLLSRTGLPGGLVLRASLDAGRGGTDAVSDAKKRVPGGAGAAPAVGVQARRLPSTADRSLLGARGVAVTDLRPGGSVLIDNMRVDVVTEGGYLPAGTDVEVISDEGYHRVVRQFERAQGAARRFAVPTRH